MEGYERISSLGDVQDGDVFVFPADRPRLHVAASTLSRHGLSVGSTCRAHNDERVVEAWFYGTRGAELRTMAATVHSHLESANTLRGMNSLAALRGTREIDSVSLMRLDEDMLPMVAGRGTACVDRLVAAVKAAYKAFGTPEMEAGLDMVPYGTGDSRQWTTLETIADSLGDGSNELRHAPHGCAGTRSSFDEDERLTYRLFLGNGVYDWHRMKSEREHRVLLGSDTLRYLESQGMEVWRPLPATWEALAKTVLARHSKQVLEECGKFDAELKEFDREYRKDLAKYEKFKTLWTAAARRLERRT